MAQLSREIAGL